MVGVWSPKFSNPGVGVGESYKKARTPHSVFSDDWWYERYVSWFF